MRKQRINRNATASITGSVMLAVAILGEPYSMPHYLAIGLIVGLYIGYYSLMR